MMMARGGGPPGMQGRGQEGLPPPDYINPYHNSNGAGNNPDSAPRGQDLYYASNADPAVGVIGQAIEMDERHGLPSTEEDTFTRQQPGQQPQSPYARHDQLSGPNPNHLQVAGEEASAQSSGESRSPTSLYSSNGAPPE
jgi:hypothetical protein